MKIKSLVKIAIVLLLLAIPVHADNVTLAWDKESDPTVNRYGIYIGAASRTYTNVIYNGCCQATYSNLVPGMTYYFAATALSTSGLESGYSAEVIYTVPIGTNSSPPGVPAPPVIQSLKRTK